MMAEYHRIRDLPTDFRSDDAESAESLGLVWQERYAKLQGTSRLKEFNERLYRAWAIETGIIERIYSIDVGTTLVLIEQGLNAALIPNEATDQPPERVAEIVQGHRNAIDAILDQIAQHRGLTNHFIRSLHQKITETQHEVEGVDQFGNRLKTPLLRGTWKQQPNNPTRSDGSVHAYCPPALVAEEMDSLVSFYGGLLQHGVKAIVRSAWLHHRFTQIHPFQDGNGRVARALVAFVLIEAGLFPIVVRREDRDVRYIAALECADSGDLSPLVTLFAEYERQQIMSALSMIEDLSPTRNSLDAILSAAKDRLMERVQRLQRKQREVLGLADDLQRSMNDTMLELANRLNSHVLINGQRADIQSSIPDTHHWFRRQIGEVAGHGGYFADMDLYHRWVRLRIRESAQGHSEIVLSLHALGRPFAGVMAANGYFARRDLDEEGRSDTGSIVPLTRNPFSFAHSEDRNEVHRRFKDWLAEILAIGLEEWRRQL
jgi:Fic family protein